MSSYTIFVDRKYFFWYSFSSSLGHKFIYSRILELKMSFKINYSFRDLTARHLQRIENSNFNLLIYDILVIDNPQGDLNYILLIKFSVSHNLNKAGITGLRVYSSGSGKRKSSGCFILLLSTMNFLFRSVSHVWIGLFPECPVFWVLYIC